MFIKAIKTTNEKRGRPVKENYNKTGKKAARKEQRREEAIARAIRNVTVATGLVDKHPKNEDYIKALAKAQKTLKEVQGKQPLRVRRYAQAA